MNFSDPRSTVLQMGLRDGMKVADLGTGSGYYALAAAAIVGASGRVFAVGVHEDMLGHVRSAAQTAGYRQVDTVWGNIEKPGGTKLKDAALDAVILANTLFQIKDHTATLHEILRILKPAGKLLVVDWAGAYGGMGPTPQHVVAEHTAEALLIAAGFHKEKSFRSGPHHYAILCTAP